MSDVRSETPRLAIGIFCPYREVEKENKCVLTQGRGKGTRDSDEGKDERGARYRKRQGKSATGEPIVQGKRPPKLNRWT